MHAFEMTHEDFIFYEVIFITIYGPMMFFVDLLLFVSPF